MQRHLCSRLSRKWTKSAGGDCTYLQILPVMIGNLIFSKLDGYAPKVCKIFKFLARRVCEDMSIILASDFNINVKDITMPNLQSSWKIPSNMMFFQIFLMERLDLILALIWSLDKKWTIYPAWTTFRFLAIIDPSWAEWINKLLNSPT
jgi:hypothetical protein